MKVRRDPQPARRRPGARRALDALRGRPALAGSRSTSPLTQGPGDARRLARECGRAAATHAVLAVGGDGTANEAACGPPRHRAPRSASSPMGSGNGLARTLGIPLRAGACVERARARGRAGGWTWDASTAGSSSTWPAPGFDAAVGDGLPRITASAAAGAASSPTSGFPPRACSPTCRRPARCARATTRSRAGARGRVRQRPAVRRRRHDLPRGALDDGLLDVVGHRGRAGVGDPAGRAAAVPGRARGLPPIPALPATRAVLEDPSRFRTTATASRAGRGSAWRCASSRARSSVLVPARHRRRPRRPFAPDRTRRARVAADFRRAASARSRAARSRARASGRRQQRRAHRPAAEARPGPSRP